LNNVSQPITIVTYKAYVYHIKVFLKLEYYKYSKKFAVYN
jgi:hypothetical protein